MNSLTAYALAHELNGSLQGATIEKITRYPGGYTLELGRCPVPYIHIVFFGREPELFASHSRIVSEDRSTQVSSTITGATVRRIETLGMDRVMLLSAETAGAWAGGGLSTVRFDMTPGGMPMAVFRMPGDRLAECHGPDHARKPSSPADRPPARPLSLLDLAATPPEHVIAGAKTGEPPPETPQHTRRWLRVKRTAHVLLSSVGGLDPVLCAALSRKFDGDVESIWPHLVAIGAECTEKRFSWYRCEFPEEGEAGRCAIYPVPLPVGGDPVVLAGAVPAVEERWREIVGPSYVLFLRSTLLAALRRDLKKSGRLAERLAADLEDANRAREYRRYGNLLVTYRHQLKRGMREISVRDFSGEETVTIPLSSSKNPEQNIRYFFVKAKKGEKGRLIIAGRKREVARDIAEGRALVERIANIDDPNELIPLLPGRRAETRGPKKSKPAPPFRRFVIDERYTVYVGRKDRENDLLTHRFAAPNDLWFHAQGVAGSHVILKGGGQPPKRVIEIAAGIAAYFSKARHSSTVPVVYTEKRYVRKPRKSPPGTASCLRGKTIYVEPSLPEQEPREGKADQ